MPKKIVSWAIRVAVIAVILCPQLFLASSVKAAAGATTSVHLVKYGTDVKTIKAEKTVDYKWMQQNLKVYGDGKIHYFHQGPVFEGDPWDPQETTNLKDKGAVKGTSVKDLCDLVGGMSRGGEVVIRAVDGYSLTLAYENIYEPQDRQGIVALCWYNGESAYEGDSGGIGYPANNAYNSALQIVFMARTKNVDDKYVFGNSDMQVCMPEEKYQHFYEGLPSTNGLSGKWISEIDIYPSQAPQNSGEQPEANDNTANSGEFPIVPIIIGGCGLILLAVSVTFLIRKKKAS